MSVVLREEIAADDINYLTSYIDKHYGYDFSNYSISSFKRRLGRILDKFNFTTIEQLTEHFQHDKAFIKTFLHEITVHATEMFRDPEFWAYSREGFLKNLFKQSKADKVNFWIAGCAGGEEVFSLAILLKEKGWYDRANIIATDIDELLFENALSGKILLKQLQTVYQDNYIKAGGTKKLSDYYTVRKDTATMNLSLLQNVTFRKHDLVKEKPLATFDVVFCRNVMIYFTPQLQNHVFHLLTESLTRKGILAIGSKESMIWSDITQHFEVINKEEKIFRRI